MKVLKWITIGFFGISILSGCGAEVTNNIQETSPADVVSPTPDATPTPTATQEPTPTPTATPKSEKEIIGDKISGIIEEVGTTWVSVEKIEVNQNMGSDEDDSYIVLAYITYEVKNTAKTTKEMIEMFINDIGVKSEKVNGADEIVLFWEVPYLKESENIAKANIARRDGNMYLDETWFDTGIFNN